MIVESFNKFSRSSKKIQDKNRTNNRRNHQRYQNSTNNRTTQWCVKIHPIRSLGLQQIYTTKSSSKCQLDKESVIFNIFILKKARLPANLSSLLSLKKKWCDEKKIRFFFLSAYRCTSLMNPFLTLINPFFLSKLVLNRIDYANDVIH